MDINRHDWVHHVSIDRAAQALECQVFAWIEISPQAVNDSVISTAMAMQKIFFILLPL